MEASPLTTSADHDLLITLNANVINLTTSINAATLATTTINTDHENRIRGLEASDQQSKGALKTQKNQMHIISFVFGAVSIALGLFSFFNK
ncbi:hypothetical protein E3T26_08595 [Cryobacterium sp. TMT1-21]|uniref:hypothetical protein n=1 Tax=Cryobacterium sp. TMT1-21 TaxID=1259234 RepID=UPI001069D9F3|nr:hypothetical protein [Cryobacterium sp. TMT1-21]TFD14172.1 hypothetical protein E3T26_08595 [Cryobacterium sp. TMT1-21]